jgi:hypothetical protein
MVDLDLRRTMTDPRAVTELRLVVDGVEYVYTAEDESKRAKELKRVAKLLAGTRERLDAKLAAIRLAESA